MYFSIISLSKLLQNFSRNSVKTEKFGRNQKNVLVPAPGRNRNSSRSLRISQDFSMSNFTLLTVPVWCTPKSAYFFDSLHFYFTLLREISKILTIKLSNTGNISPYLYCYFNTTVVQQLLLYYQYLVVTTVLSQQL